MIKYVINLDADTKRLEDTKVVFSSANLTFERIPAVAVSDMTPEEKKKAASPFLFYLANSRRVRQAEIACGLSHIKCWKTAFADGAVVAAVFEDDVCFDAELLNVHLDEIEKTNDPNIPTVWLLQKGLPKGKHNDCMWYELTSTKDVGHSWCTICYVINASAAERITKILTPMSNVIDAWSTFARCGIRVLVASKPCATNRAVVSTIKRSTRRLWKYSLFRKFYWFRYHLSFWFDILFLKARFRKALK